MIPNMRGKYNEHLGIVEGEIKEERVWRLECLGSRVSVLEGGDGLCGTAPRYS